MTVNTDFELGQTGSITTAHDINVVSTNRDITLSGATNSQKLNLTATKGNVTMNGNVQSTSITVAGKKAFVSGILNSTGEIKFTMTQDFTLNAPGRLITAEQHHARRPGHHARRRQQRQRLPIDRNQGPHRQRRHHRATTSRPAPPAASSTPRSPAARASDSTLTNDFVTGSASSLSATDDITVTTTGSALLSGLMNTRVISVTATGGDIVLNATSDLRATNAITLFGATATIRGRLDAPTVSVTGTGSLLLDTRTGYITANYVTLNSVERDGESEGSLGRSRRPGCGAPPIPECRGQDRPRLEQLHPPGGLL